VSPLAVSNFSSSLLRIDVEMFKLVAKNIFVTTHRDQKWNPLETNICGIQANYLFRLLFISIKSISVILECPCHT